MQAIITKYIPVTDTKPNRVKAIAQAGSVILSWNDSLNVDENHEQAARALMAKFNWFQHSKIIGSGALPNGTGYAFVLGSKK